MSETKVQIEVESLENKNVQFRIARDGKMLIGFELTKEQMLSVFEYLTKQIASGESGGSTLTFGAKAEDKE